MKTTKSFNQKRSRRIPLTKSWLFFCAVFFFCNAVLSITAAPSPNEEELSNTRHCKTLCDQCGALGFYCGEECICECNDDRSDTECIARVQRDATQLKLPFNILLQGSEKNSFLRNAIHYEQDSDRDATSFGSSARNKRSTVVIYKPSKNSPSDQCERRPPAIASSESVEKSIKKRSVKQFDWLNDLTNAFLGPSAKRMARKNNEPAFKSENSRELRKSSSKPKKFNPSWFKDNAKFLLQPAPLYRRQADNGNTEEDDESAMAKFPELLRETINNIQNTGVNDDLGQALRSRITDGSEALQSQLQSKSFNRFLREAVKTTLRKLRAAAMMQQDSGTEEEDSSEMESQGEKIKSPQVAKSKFQFLPWFRPRRFLELMQRTMIGKTSKEEIKHKK